MAKISELTGEIRELAGKYSGWKFLEDHCEQELIREDAKKHKIMKSTLESSRYKNICSKARLYEIKNHPMLERDENEQSMYLRLLRSVMAIEGEENEKNIFILFRIAHGMKYKGKIDELFNENMQEFDYDRLYDIIEHFSDDNVLIGVASDHPYLAHALAIQRFREAGGYVENEG